MEGDYLKILHVIEVSTKDIPSFFATCMHMS